MHILGRFYMVKQGQYQIVNDCRAVLMWCQPISDTGPVAFGGDHAYHNLLAPVARLEDNAMLRFASAKQGLSGETARVDQRRKRNTH